jgi:hypothetical protein
MRVRFRTDRPLFVVGLIGIVELLGLAHPGSAGAQVPPRRPDAAGVAGPEKEPAERPTPVRTVELPAAVLRSCKVATALVDLESRGSGSAVCVSATGFFVTNNHVVKDVGLGAIVRLVLHPGEDAQRVLHARVIKLAEEDDLALLKADAPPALAPLPMGTETRLSETMTVTAFGYPFGRILASEGEYPAASVNLGTVTALRRKDGRLSLIQIDAAVNPGNSGGPLVDAGGNLLGIIVSGYQGTRVNFAIPISRVREFLKSPALLLRDVRIRFPDRAKPSLFPIDAYAVAGLIPSDLNVELILSADHGEPRTLRARRVGDHFVAEGVPLTRDNTPGKPILVARKGRGEVRGEIPAADLSFGGRKFSWLGVESLSKDGGEWVLSLLNGERYAGAAVSLPELRWAKDRTTQLATADRIEVRWDGELPTELKYQIEATRGGENLGQISGQLSIAEMPRTLTPNFGSPIARSNLQTPIVIEAVVPAALNVLVTPSGLLISTEKGAAPAGMEDEKGRYILVNGQPWYPERAGGLLQLPDGGSASLLPIMLGGREPQFHLLWAREDVNSPHDGGRAALSVRNEASQVLFAASVRNQVSRPTRVALAITFDPPSPIYGYPPPRTSPVLESHWPLNDKETDRAADLGPAKRYGRTSVAQSIPGVRGSGIQIDHQAILCPGVLPVERTDAFSCSAWIKPRPLMAGGAVFGRMSLNHYRGFDLFATAGGNLEAHVASSWDGNAIGVVTVERFDPSEWHHVAVTYDGSSRARGLMIHVDGAPTTLKYIVDRLSESTRNEIPFAIGGREGRDRFQGQLDEVRAYNRGLSADEIYELYDLDRSNLKLAPGSTLNQGLVGYWPFEGPAAERFRDRSGQGHHGQPEVDAGTPEIAKADGGQALRLNGQGALDSGVVFGFDRNDPHSLGLWFKPRNTEFQTLLATVDRLNRGIQLAFFQGHIYYYHTWHWDSNVILVRTEATYPTNVWHQVTVTYDGSSKAAGVKVFVDGTEAPWKAERDSLSASTKYGSSFLIGGRIEGVEYLNGEIDDAFVYNRRLSTEEARAFFSSGRNQPDPFPPSRRNGLVGCWTFEGQGEEAYRDRSSGNGHVARPMVRAGHSSIIAQGPTRVARFEALGGIDCGQAGDFEGTDAFSAGGWFRWEGGPMTSLVSKMLHNGPYRGYDIAFDGDRYFVQVTNDWIVKNSIFIKTERITPDPTNTGWTHVFFTYDGSRRASGLKLYLNGELYKNMIVEQDNLTKSVRVAEPFVIGARPTGFMMRGRAANVRVIPRALTADEVRRLARSDRPEGARP